MNDSKEKTGDTKKRVAIVYPFPYLDSIPSLCNAAQLLSQQGFTVDIFTRTSPTLEKPVFEDSRINVISHRDRQRYTQSIVQTLADEGKGRRNVIKRLIQRLVSVAKKIVPTNLLSILLRPFSILDTINDIFTVFSHHRKCPYRCFIGVDAQGLIEAQKLKKFVNVPLAYWSLELLLSYELQNNVEKKLKQKEIRLSDKASFIIIQDEGRAGLLAKDDNLPMDKFILVPNSPLGPVHRQKLDYWHRRFDLPRQKKVVIHAGNIDAWTGISEIVDSAPGWPEEWVLVVHTRFAARHTQEFLDLQQRADPERVFFSTNPVSRKEYDELIDSADIGIAFYMVVKDSVSSQENIRTIGLSSGKVAYYLRSGLPVIINNTTSLGTFIRDEGCGVVISGEQEIGHAIKEINSGYEKYRSGAYRCFENKLDFTGSFANVIKRIEVL